MQKLNDLSRSLAPLEPDGTLIAVIEMSQLSWLVPRKARLSSSVSSRSVLARRCSRDTATLDAWITWASMLRALNQRASQKPSRPASKATAMRSILRPAFSASSRHRLLLSLAVGSTSSIKIIGPLPRFPASPYAHRRGHNSAAPRRLRPAAIPDQLHRLKLKLTSKYLTENRNCKVNSSRALRSRLAGPLTLHASSDDAVATNRRRSLKATGGYSYPIRSADRGRCSLTSRLIGKIQIGS